MSTVTKPKPSTRRHLEPERRLVIRGARWDDYVTLVDSLSEHSPLRVAFDGRDIEIMTKGMDHEQFSFLIAQLIVAVAQVRGVNVEPYGETTWRKPEIKRGLEADQWFFFDDAKRKQLSRIKQADKVSGRKTGIEHLPSPDLAVEIDISAPEVDRQSVYAALNVTELWRFDGENAVIERLTPEGRYEAVDKSEWLGITSADLVRWLIKEDTTEFIPWLNRVTKWARRRFARKRT
jgi:Uma2 family endonuclease